MKRNNMAFGGAAVLTAAAAIGAGAMVSSGAMAASTTDPGAAVVSLVNVGADGAFTCKFSADDLPLPALPGTPARAMGGAGVVVSGAVTSGGDGAPVLPPGAVPGGPTLTHVGTGAGDGTDGPVLVTGGETPPPDGTHPMTGVLTVSGSVGAAGVPKAVQVNPDGTTSDLEVRDGTAEECAKAMDDMKSATATASVSTASGGTPEAATSESDG